MAYVRMFRRETCSACLIGAKFIDGPPWGLLHLEVQGTVICQGEVLGRQWHT